MAYLDDDTFLLQSPTARRLYHEVAKDQPIFDYHCHLSPAEIAGNHRWDNLADIWLGGDHYKWRLLRANGIDEEYITGAASPREKFQAESERKDRLHVEFAPQHGTPYGMAREFRPATSP